MAKQYVSKGNSQIVLVFQYLAANQLEMTDYPVVVWQIEDTTGVETPLITATWPPPLGSPDVQWQPAWANYFELPPDIGMLVWPDHYRQLVKPFFDWMATGNPSGGATTTRKIRANFTRPLLQRRWAEWSTQNPSFTW